MNPGMTLISTGMRLGMTLTLLSALGGCGVIDRATGSAMSLFKGSPAKPAEETRTAEETPAPALEVLAREMLANGDAVAALPLARKAAARYPERASLALLHGEVALAAAEYDEALSAFDQAATLDGASPRASAGRGVTLLSLGRVEEARDALNSVTGDPAANASVLSNAGLALALLGDNDQAVKVLERAIANPASTARTRQNLALAYMLAGERERAMSMALVDLDRESALQQLARWSQMPQLAPSERMAFVSGRPVPSAPATALADANWRENAAIAALRIVDPEQKVATAALEDKNREPGPLLALPLMADQVLDANETPLSDTPPAVPTQRIAENQLVAAPAQVTRIALKPEPGKAVVTQASATIAPAAKPAPTPAPSPGLWAIQLGSFRHKESIAVFRAHVLRQLEAAYASVAASLRTVPETHADGRPIYRLVGGSYATAAQAKPVCADMRKNRLDCFIWSKPTPTQAADRAPATATPAS